MHETTYHRPEEVIDEPQGPRDRRRKDPQVPDPQVPDPGTPGDPVKRHIDSERRKNDIQPPPESPNPIPNGPEIGYDDVVVD